MWSPLSKSFARVAVTLIALPLLLKVVCDAWAWQRARLRVRRVAAAAAAEAAAAGRGEVRTATAVSRLTHNRVFRLNFFNVTGPIGFQKAGAIFALYSLRIGIMPLWTLPYVPVLSPLYRQGVHWLSTNARTAAILLHVGSGSVGLLCGVRQFNRELRRKNKPLHRLLGRVYVAAGCICVLSLGPLWSTIGKGSGAGPSPMVQSMTVVANGMWVVATAIAVARARAGEVDEHRVWMIRSYLLLSVPITQRMVDFTLATFVFAGRAAAALAAAHIEWLRGTGAGLFGAQSLLANAAAARWSDAASVSGDAAGGAVGGEVVLSFNGFGRAQQFCFGFSAWSGLIINIAIAHYITSGQIGGGDLHETTTWPLVAKLLGIELQPDAAVAVEPSEDGGGGGAALGVEGAAPAELEAAPRSADDVNSAERVALITPV
jgi:uncharacterized membrane protein